MDNFEANIAHCRLCFYKTDSLFMIDIYQQKDYSEKLTKYLHLKIKEDDDKLSKYICLNCSQSCDVFGCFYEKIHKVQKIFLTNEYEDYVLELAEKSRSQLQEVVIEEIFEPSTFNLQGDCSVIEVENADKTTFSKTEKNNGKVLEKRLTKRKSLNKPNKTEKQSEIEFEELKKTDSLDVKQKSSLETINKSALKVYVSDDESENEASLLFYKQGVPNQGNVREKEDWMASEKVKEFPKQIIKNGVQVIKGPKMVELIEKFYDLSCSLCEQKSKFQSLKILLDHYQETHKVKGFVQCCQKNLSSMSSIVLHMASHLQPEAFRCEICGYQVTRPKFLEHHKRTHLSESSKYSCDLCPKKFCWKGALKIHILSHLPPGERKVYTCQICNKTYGNPGSLSTHKKLVHKNQKSERTICHLCTKTFNSSSSLNEHIKMIHYEGRDKFQIQCKECGKWLKNQRCLKNHMLLHSNKNYVCDLCPYTTKKPALLKKHNIMIHTDEKKFECKFCSKQFKLKRLLTVHMACHSDKKSSILCNFCDRTFANSTNFYTHRKNMHSKELEEMKMRELEEQRRKRIEIGLEKDDFENGAAVKIGSNVVILSITNISN